MATPSRRTAWTIGLVAGLVLILLGAVLLSSLAAKPNSTAPGGSLPSPNPPSPAGPASGNTSGPVTVRAGWDGIQYGSNHGVLDYVDPPDVPLAVGPDHVFELANGLGIIWTKSGSFVQTVNPQGLFQVSATDGIGDARVIYDGLSGRWFASGADFTTGDVVLAVSTTSDPTGTWRAFSYATGQGCPDQPWMGLSSDKVVLSLNTFSACDRAFTGGMFWAINKTDLVSGATPRFATWGPNLNFLNMVPVQGMSPGGTAYIAWPIQPNYVRVFTLDGVPPATVTLSYHDYTVSTLTNAPNAVQPGTNYTLRTGDNRLRDGFWSTGRLWITYNDGCVPAGDSAGRACVRLTQLDTTNRSVLQDFDVGLANAYTFYPAIRADGNGNLIAVFGLSSTTVYPSVVVAFRAPTDALNTLGTWTTVRAGTGPRAPGSGSCSSGVCRYGDYFGVAVDPGNTSRVWTAGEYGNTTGWGTYVSEVSASSSTPPLPPAPPRVTTLATVNVSPSGATLQGNLTSLGTAMSVTVGFIYGTSSALSGATNVSLGLQNMTGAFATTISGLLAITTYYYRAWADGQGFAAGSILNFTTPALPPPGTVFLTFSYASVGGGSGASAPALAYVHGGVGETATLTASPTSFTADLGTAWNVTNPLAGSGTSERWKASQLTNGTASASMMTVFLYHHQYTVAFAFVVVGGGSGYSAPSVTYTACGAAAATGPGTPVWADAGGKFQFQNPLPGSTSTNGWRTNSGGGTVASSTTYTATYRHQFKLKFKTTSLSGTPTPVTPLINATVFGTWVGIPSDAEAWVDAGGTYDFPGVFYGPLAGERWITYTPASGTVVGPMNLTAAYLHQYFLTIQVNSRAGGRVSLDSEWYNETTPLGLQAQVTPGWRFEGWVGSGNGSYTGLGSSASIRMNGPLTETAIFYAGLTLTAGPGGSVQYAYGGSSGSVPSGGSETLYVAPGTNVTVTAAPSWFYRFDGWNGGNPEAGPRETLFMSAPQSLSAAFGISLYSQIDSVLSLTVAFAFLVLVALTSRRRRRKKTTALREARARGRARAPTYR